ncbi:hypothetical protein AIGOOFII_0190 [Methylobacterium marchantiae]|nr:hypothetical protein AIGOOFII_0190 [Methylobacterium marchantiae]
MRFGRFSLRDLRDDCHGATAVEFGLVGLLFFGLIAAILEVVMLLLAQLSLDNALDRAGRSVFTGTYQEGASSVNPATRLITELCKGVTLFTCNDQTIKLEMTVSTDYAKAPTSPYDSTTNTESATFGNKFDCPKGGEIVTIVAAAKLPRYFNYMQVFARPLPDYKQQIQSTILFQAEPYPQGSC